MGVDVKGENCHYKIWWIMAWHKTKKVAYEHGAIWVCTLFIPTSWPMDGLCTG
jgi:hypothetical protein